jgi:2-dehydro-3-deoxy-D-arabinonate dehydratase
MKIYKTEAGILLEHKPFRIVKGGWDELVNRENLGIPDGEFLHLKIFPMVTTCFQSIAATHRFPGSMGGRCNLFQKQGSRMDESGNRGASFYDKVYEAERPELF